MKAEQAEWVSCPRCGNAHFIKVRRDTVLVNFPAWCKKCKSEVNMSVRAREPSDRQ